MYYLGVLASSNYVSMFFWNVWALFSAILSIYVSCKPINDYINGHDSNEPHLHGQQNPNETISFVALLKNWITVPLCIQKSNYMHMHTFLLVQWTTHLNFAILRNLSVLLATHYIMTTVSRFQTVKPTVLVNGVIFPDHNILLRPVFGLGRKKTLNEPQYSGSVFFIKWFRSITAY